MKPRFRTTDDAGSFQFERAEADPLDFVYDIECLMNCFTLTVEHIQSGTRLIFEISERYNHSVRLYGFIKYLQSIGARMVGFNNIGYDYPLVHLFAQLYIAQGDVQPLQLYNKSQAIIKAYGDAAFAHMVWESDMLVKQLDLYKIHHFDNKAKRTGLKYLEFQMRSGDIETMAVEWDKPLTVERIDPLIKYNAHDVRETLKFYMMSLPQIHMRDELSAKHGIDFTNFNDTKIGKKYFITKLEADTPGICFTREGRKKVPRQTHRSSIRLADVIQPDVQFSPDSVFQPVLRRLRDTVLDGGNINSPPELKDLTATRNGFQFDFGAGGIHGSMKGVTVREDADHAIVDIDVEGYYPAIAMVRGIHPEHLGQQFCTAYRELREERLRRGKKTTEGQMLKLAQNGVYGDSNNKYGPFYDPQYTMTITINGQLYLTMLADQLMNLPGVQMVQINTDGMTVKLPRDQSANLMQECAAWENHTGFVLEYTKYRSMFIRDVNNYIAVTGEGDIKRKGAYQWKTDDPTNLSKSLVWHQNWSSLVVPYAVERVLLHGEDLDEVIGRHDDAWDFMIIAKIPGGSKLTYGKDGPVLQNVTRYHMAVDGEELWKVMPPLKKNPGVIRYFRVNVDQPVNVCNDVTKFDWSRLNRGYYLKEARKLIDAVSGTI